MCVILICGNVGFNRMIIHQDSLRWEHYRFQLNYLHVQHCNSEMQSFPLTTEDLLIDISFSFRVEMRSFPLFDRRIGVSGATEIYSKGWSKIHPPCCLFTGLVHIEWFVILSFMFVFKLAYMYNLSIPHNTIQAWNCKIWTTFVFKMNRSIAFWSFPVAHKFTRQNITIHRKRIIERFTVNTLVQILNKNISNTGLSFCWISLGPHNSNGTTKYYFKNKCI